MKTPRTRIAQIIADQTLQQGVSRRLSQEVAAYLLAERRVGELDSVLRDIQADWAALGHVEVIATSAHALTAAIQADIRQQVNQLYPSVKQIVITEAVDPALIGGVRLSLPDQQFDASLRTKLNHFKQLTEAKG